MVEAPSGARDPAATLALIASRRPSLELSTLDLGLLVALHARAAATGLGAFTEGQLEEAFAAAAQAIEPDADVRRRAPAAIQRLRTQRLLARVDGQGVVRSGEFALTRLAASIVEFFLEDDVLTTGNLAVLTASVQAVLATVRAAAEHADDAPTWATSVEAPLRVTARELVAGIERRQRGLDLQQEEFQGNVQRLLDADWFGAVAACQALLEDTSATLRELATMLLRDVAQLRLVLHDIEDRAVAAGQPEAERAAQRVLEQLDRVAAWGAGRQRAWSEYFQYVHRYLRDVVRLDPERALTHRLREQLAGSGPRFALAVVAEGPMRVLREARVVRPAPPVVRPRAPRERELAAAPVDDPQRALDAEVRATLAAGAATLSSVTRAITAPQPPVERYLLAGRVAQTVARLAEARGERERAWVASTEELLVEEWTVAPREAS